MSKEFGRKLSFPEYNLKIRVIVEIVDGKSILIGKEYHNVTIKCRGLSFKKALFREARRIWYYIRHGLKYESEVVCGKKMIRVKRPSDILCIRYWFALCYYTKGKSDNLCILFVTSGSSRYRKLSKI